MEQGKENSSALELMIGFHPDKLKLNLTKLGENVS